MTPVKLNVEHFADLRMVLDEAAAEKRGAELARREKGRELGNGGHASASDRERAIDLRIETLHYILKHAR
jgi:hypothetical protein